jgi:high-affinity Fe2+/Pb2+ permease
VADSHKGYKQWQGSRAQMLAQKDIAAGKHDMPGMTKEKLHRSKPEYREFPLKAFCDKYQQEISTKKYLYTIKKIGRDPKKWKKQHSSHMKKKKKKKDQQGTSNENDASSSALRDDELDVE